MDEIVLTFFRSKTDTTGSREALNWPQLRTRFNDFSVGVPKDQLPAFSPTIFTGSRSKANAEAVTMLVLDYDGNLPTGEGIAQFETLGHRFILHTSHSHRRAIEKNPLGLDRFRVLLPLASPIPANQYPRLWRWAAGLTSGKIDRACRDAGRLFFLPGVADDDSEFEFVVGEGSPLDWRALQLPDEIKVSSSMTATRALSEWPAHVPRDAARLLAGEPSSEEYKSTSELEMAIILPLVRAGFGQEAIASLLESGFHESKYRRLQEQSPDVAEMYLNGSIDNAMKAPHSREFEVAQDRAAVIRQSIECMTWTGRPGMTDRAVLLAHCAIMEQAGKLAYHASVRDVAEHAQCAPSTVSKAHKRLIAAGFLLPRSHFREADGGASYYRLDEKRFRIGNTQSIRKRNSTLLYSPSLLTECSIGGKSSFGGVFEDRQGVGKAGQIIYETLLRGADALTPGEIQERCNRALSTIYKKLPAMESIGIIERTTDGRKYVAIVPEDVDWQAIGEQLGTVDIAAGRRERHERERAEYRARGSKFHNPSAENYLRLHHPELLHVVTGQVLVETDAGSRPQSLHNSIVGGNNAAHNHGT